MQTPLKKTTIWDNSEKDKRYFLQTFSKSWYFWMKKVMILGCDLSPETTDPTD